MSTASITTAATRAAAADWSAVSEAWDAAVTDVDAHTATATDAMLTALDIRPGERVLELACGPGSLGARLSQLVGSGGHVVLSDVAPGMVDVARRRNADLANVTVEETDAASIPHTDASFDVVLARMGLMFTTEPANAIAEARRVLGGGGRFAAMTWAGAEHNPWIASLGLAAMANGLAPGVLPTESGGIFSLGDADTLAGLAEAGGFSGVEVAEHDVVFASATVEAHITGVGSLAGPLAAALGSAPDDVRSAVRQTATDLLAPYVTADGAVEAPGRLLLVLGRR